MIDLAWIQSSVIAQNYRYSRHGDRERQNDALFLDDVEQIEADHRAIVEHRKSPSRFVQVAVQEFETATR